MILYFSLVWFDEGDLGSEHGTDGESKDVDRDDEGGKFFVGRFEFPH